MTHVVGVRFCNWRCFKGEHELDLEPRVYAVVARHDRDDDRSNWLGKSTFGEGIRFCLTGQLRKDEAADAWITRGEDAGEVSVELSNGMLITRERARGSATRLTIEIDRGGEVEVLSKDQAQVALDELTGGRDFYDFTAFFEQGKTDRYVRMTPGERTEVVSEWLGLEPVQRAEAHVRRGVLTELQAEYDRCSAGLQATDQRVAQEPGETGNPIKVMKRLIGRHGQDAEEAQQAATKQRRTIEELNAAAATRAAWLAARDDQARLREIIDELATMPRTTGSSASEAKETKARARYQEIQTQHRDAYQELAKKKRLVTQGFDGQCPVSSGVQCPIADKISCAESKKAKEVQQLDHRVDEIAEDLGQAKQAVEVARDETKAAARVAVRRETLKSERARLESRVRAYQGMSEPREVDVAGPSDELARLITDAARASDAVKFWTRELQSYEQRQARMQEIEGRLRVARAACMILGRAGVQRTMGESALGEIATGANAALSRAGVDLRVGVSWSRETKKLDEACRSCGYHYGKGQREKKCPDCGAAREPALDNRLSIDLSAESGGAADITGFVFQLAAAAWLRRRRDRGLASSFIDEPFGAVDRANRLALAAQLHGMLERDFGVEQAFVVAHDPDTLDTLPGRIVIRSDGAHSRVEVEA